MDDLQAALKLIDLAKIKRICKRGKDLVILGSTIKLKGNIRKQRGLGTSKDIPLVQAQDSNKSHSWQPKVPKHLGYAS